MAAKVAVAQNALNGIAGSVNRLGEALNIGLGGKLAFGVLGYQMLDLANKFDEGVDRMMIKTGLIGTELGANLRRGIRELATARASAADELTMMAAQLAEVPALRAAPDALLRITAATDNLRLAVGVNYEAAGSIVAKVARQFNLSTDEMETAVDTIAAAARNLDLAEFDAMLKSGAVTAAQFGSSFADIAAVFVRLDESGFNTRVAQTALQGLFNTIGSADPPTRFRDVLGQLGIRARDLQRGDGSLKSLPEILDLFSRHGMTATQAVYAFGTGVGAPLAALLDTTRGSLTDVSAALTKQGTAATMAAALNDDYAGSLEKLKNSWNNLLLSMMESTGAADALNSAVKTLNDSVKSISPGMRKFITVVAGLGIVLIAVSSTLIFIGATITAVGKVLPIIGTMVAGLSKAFTALRVAMWAVKAVMLVVAANPILIMLGALVILLVQIIRYWDDLKQVFSSWEGPLEVLHGMWLGLVETFWDALEALKAIGSWVAEKSRPITDMVASLTGLFMPAASAPVAAAVGGNVGVDIRVSATGGATAAVTDTRQSGQVRPRVATAGQVGRR